MSLNDNCFANKSYMKISVINEYKLYNSLIISNLYVLLFDTLFKNKNSIESQEN